MLPLSQMGQQTNENNDIAAALAALTEAKKMFPQHQTVRHRPLDS
jgi:hypothetical protein